MFACRALAVVILGGNFDPPVSRVNELHTNAPEGRRNLLAMTGQNHAIPLDAAAGTRYPPGGMKTVNI